MIRIILLLFLLPLLIYPQSQPIDTNKIKPYKTITEIEKEDTSQKPLIVKIENIPEGDSFWFEFFKILLPTLAGGFILWVFQNFTQKKQNRKQEFENRINSYLEHQKNILNDIKVEISLKYEIYTEPHQYEKFEGRQFFIFSRTYIKALYDFLLTDTAQDEYAEGLSTNSISSKDLIEFYNECPYRTEIDDGKYKPSKEKELEISQRVYEFYFNYYKDYIGHYFRHLYNILDYISEKKKIFGKKSNEPQFLADMIQARLSAAELFLLFYNGIIPRFEKMYDEISTYHVIENLVKEDLLNPQIHPEFYPVCEMKSIDDLLKKRKNSIKQV